MGRSNKATRAPSAGARNCTLAACNDCPALCCHGLSIPIDKPRTRSDIDVLRWELQYDTVRCYVRSHRWYLYIEGRCIYLDEQNMCTIYARRPDVCRRHGPPDCEKFGPFYDVMIETPEQLDAYLEKERQRTRKRRAAGRRNKR